MAFFFCMQITAANHCQDKGASCYVQVKYVIFGMHFYPANDKKVIVKKRPLCEKKIYLTGKTWSCFVV